MNACKTILIVEDDLDIQASLRDALEAEGFNVLAAENGRHALDILDSAQKPALIFLDIMMPIMDGREFLRLVRGDIVLAPIPVIVTSASVHDDAVEGATSFIKKPYDLPTVLKVAHQHCNL